MRSFIKICGLPLVICSLTACGGGGNNGGSTTSSSVTLSSSISSSSLSSSSSTVASSVESSASTSSESSSSQSSLGESVGSATSYTNYTVAEISDCGLGVSAANKTYALFADYDAGAMNQMLLNFSGWNHATNGSTTEWVNLKYTGSTYNYSSSAKVNDSCNGVDTLNMILLKKIADWDHQHSNGFERNILSSGYKFGDVENIIIDVKINSAKTFIPDVDSLKTKYASYISSGSVIDTFEAGKINIGITLQDNSLTNTSLNAAINIQLDQSTLMDKWVRVTIPMKDMKFYSETNYTPTTKTLADLSNIVIKRALFVAETKTNEVLRNKISNTWNVSAPPPETFKEMDLSFKKIEFQLK